MTYYINGYIFIIYYDIKKGGGDNMPNRDGTGPQGKGPQTGRGAGSCDKSKDSKKILGFGRKIRGAQRKNTRDN